MQTPSARGLTPAEDEDRFDIVPIYRANDELAQSLKADWAGRTPKKAREVLESKDISVTNKSDKDKQLPKLIELHQEVVTGFQSASDAVTSFN